MPGRLLLTLEALKQSAVEYATHLSDTPIPELFGTTDGKAVGTYVEAGFNAYIGQRYEHDQGNAAKSIDFPELNVDLKVTSIDRPQSSSPFQAAAQKVYGLGHHLLVFVYEKQDDSELSAARLNVRHVVFIEQEATGDFQTTSGILGIIESDGNVDDIDAFLEERRLPLDESGRRKLAERIVADPPRPGYLTISNALQWRLQYGRAIVLAAAAKTSGVEALHAEG